MMAKPRDFEGAFEQLKGILKPYEASLKLIDDSSTNYYLDAGYSTKFKKDVFFAATTIKKNYVSFYLMPVYIYPDLLDGISDALKKRMQGKACFNLTAPDEMMIAELTQLTQKGVERYRQDELLPVVKF